MVDTRRSPKKRNASPPRVSNRRLSPDRGHPPPENKSPATDLNKNDTNTKKNAQSASRKRGGEQTSINNNNGTPNNGQEIENSGTSDNGLATPPNRFATPNKNGAGNNNAALLDGPPKSNSPATDLNKNDNNSILSSETEKNTTEGESINQEKKDGSVVPTSTPPNNTEKTASTPTEPVPKTSCKPSPTNNEDNLRHTKSFDAQIHNTMWVYLYPHQTDQDGNIVCKSLCTNYNTYRELACKNIMLSFLGNTLPRKQNEEGKTSPGNDMEILLVPAEEESCRVSLYDTRNVPIFVLLFFDVLIWTDFELFYGTITFLLNM